MKDPVDASSTGSSLCLEALAGASLGSLLNLSLSRQKTTPLKHSDKIIESAGRGFMRPTVGLSRGTRPGLRNT